MAKASIHCSIAKPDEFKAHLAAVFIRAGLEGVDLTTHGKQSGAKLICYAVRLGAEASAISSVKAAPAIPQTTGTTDAERVIAARGDMTRADCARAAGLKDESSVRNVETRGMRLGGKLLAWVEAQEAGGAE